ncbi:MAG: hypothetical protein FWD23_11845 [Oscillospiraceae bacterium]|nr:hypothetical protein [Oscillospiraceae bacterium]
MNSIIMNFDDSVDINAAYVNLKKLYPTVKMAKAVVDLEEAEDEYLLALAEERLENDTGVRYTREDIMLKFGITEEDLENTGDVELEYEI